MVCSSFFQIKWNAMRKKHLGGQLWGEKMVKRAIVKNSNFTALCRITPLCTDNKISKKIQRVTVDFLMSSSLPGAISVLSIHQLNQSNWILICNCNNIDHGWTISSSSIIQSGKATNKNVSPTNECQFQKFEFQQENGNPIHGSNGINKRRDHAIFFCWLDKRERWINGKYDYSLQ